MTSRLFPTLFSPLTIRGKTIRNRVLSTGHDTVMPTDGFINDRLIAYQEARAKGGAGLIVLQVAGVHETARYTSHMLMATDDACIEGYRQMAERLHAHGAMVFAQIFHPGREIMESGDGLLAVAWSSSATPNERFHVMPRAMTRTMIREIIDGYASAARRIAAAGIDGVEILASQGYLPAQFLNPRINRRTDDYGGSDDNRMRFLSDIIAAVRAVVPDHFVIGMRISAGERDELGLTLEEALSATRKLEVGLDYVSLVSGTSASLGGAIHIAPPMAVPHDYLRPEGAAFKKALSIPVMLTGRINQPQEAEAILASGSADMCGMTRAMIADSQMPNKAMADRPDDIRACIACNQACIGHFHKGLPVSCIQSPESGREQRFGRLVPADRPKQVLVIGGGPAGLKAAITAARRGHHVTLHEASGRLGGQALLAQLLPRRAEFGGLITNLERELKELPVTVVKNSRLDADAVVASGAEAVIVATGATPYRPDFESDGQIRVIDAWDILNRTERAGSRVVVADWRADWVGPGLAEMLAREGSQVTLAVAALMAGETLPLYVRDDIAGNLHKLGVPIVPYARLYGLDGDTAYFQHVASGEPILFEGVDTVVLAQGHRPMQDLGDALEGRVKELFIVGDCAAPRTAEEAVFEGFRAGFTV